MKKLSIEELLKLDDENTTDDEANKIRGIDHLSEEELAQRWLLVDDGGPCEMPTLINLARSR